MHYKLCVFHNSLSWLYQHHYKSEVWTEQQKAMCADSSHQWHGLRNSRIFPSQGGYDNPTTWYCPHSRHCHHSYQWWWWWVTRLHNQICTLICSVTMLRSHDLLTLQWFWGSNMDHITSVKVWAPLRCASRWRMEYLRVFCFSLSPLWMWLQLVTTAAL